jgi:hypothetical protein
LFKDVSSYSFDSYRRELASDLTLQDLQKFSERFLTKHRRQVVRKDDLVDFLVPDVLKTKEMPERWRNATFDRKTAIDRPDSEFLALGHPFVDAMLAYVGSYDFGGLTAQRCIKEPKLAGVTGYLFIFVLRQRITRDVEDECLFKFTPVFVRADGQIDEEAVSAALEASTVESMAIQQSRPDPELAFQAARYHIEKTEGLWDWVDDVEFLGMSWVRFE